MKPEQERQRERERERDRERERERERERGRKSEEAFKTPMNSVTTHLKSLYKDECLVNKVFSILKLL